jgi:four helix bundle protein
MRSASEVEYHLLLAKDPTLLTPADYETVTPRARKLKPMLTALIQKAEC